jgi:hypothetical protein
MLDATLTYNFYVTRDAPLLEVMAMDLYGYGQRSYVDDKDLYPTDQQQAVYVKIVGASFITVLARNLY